MPPDSNAHARIDQAYSVFGENGDSIIQDLMRTDDHIMNVSADCLLNLNSISACTQILAPPIPLHPAPNADIERGADCSK